MTAPVLAIDEVHVTYRARGKPPVHAVAGVSLDVQHGEIVGLVGESGCGKSSLARVAAGLSSPSAGQVMFAGRPVTPLAWRRRPAEQTKLQMIFQDPGASLNPRRAVGAQLLDSATTGRDRVAALLEQVGMPADSAARYPHEFSGGQRQRLAIARALAADPRLIIADEPVTALDASAQAQVITLLLSLVQETGVSLLFISHDLALVHEIADRTTVMYLGKAVETAPTRTLMARPRHPYTRALLAAIPQVSATATLPTPLAGDVPDPANAPTGCRFRPRCVYARDVCHTEPALRPIGTSDHLAACHRIEEIEAAPDEPGHPCDVDNGAEEG